MILHFDYLESAPAPVRPRLGEARIPEQRGPGAVALAATRGGLSQGISHRTLLSWVRVEAEKLNWRSECVERSRPLLQPWPQTLLCVWSFAWATGVFGSGEVIRACLTDAFYQELCRGRCPLEEELEAFLDRYLGLVEQVFANLLLRAARAGRQWSVSESVNQ